ncbi:hypothetical protein PPERSA_03231 [Pseudocohnilembus persalinus]|uniref:Uncharacterized protein n=1 Tax=Pseudocohnilembus persalinus TaxID=266149 RepID=A0A0V0QYQ7_PSEPJ|nr:hypothetical protein PPERSA_03231 [Pseudocohnilembus persalinus]|eukprot:KRX07398.1 hypothetical protein PPERSA_03231 [Pseudocohnilembus persalinus]
MKNIYQVTTLDGQFGHKSYNFTDLKQTNIEDGNFAQEFPYFVSNTQFEEQIQTNEDNYFDTDKLFEQNLEFQKQESFEEYQSHQQVSCSKILESQLYNNTKLPEQNFEDFFSSKNTQPSEQFSYKSNFQSLDDLCSNESNYKQSSNNNNSNKNQNNNRGEILQENLNNLLNEDISLPDEASEMKLTSFGQQIQMFVLNSNLQNNNYSKKENEFNNCANNYQIRNNSFQKEQKLQSLNYQVKFIEDMIKQCKLELYQQIENQNITQINKEKEEQQQEIIEKLKQEILELNQKFEHQNQVHLKTTYNLENEQQQKLEELIQTHEKQLQALKKSYNEKLNSEKQEQEQFFSEKIKKNQEKYENQLQNLEQTINQLNQQLTQSTQVGSNFETSGTLLTQTDEGQKSQISKKDQEIQSIQQTKLKLSKDLESQKKLIKQLQINNNDLFKSQVPSLKKQVSDKTSEIQILKEMVSSMKTVVRMKDQEIKKLKTQISIANKNNQNEGKIINKSPNSQKQINIQSVSNNKNQQKIQQVKIKQGQNNIIKNQNRGISDLEDTLQRLDQQDIEENPIYNQPQFNSVYGQMDNTEQIHENTYNNLKNQNQNNLNINMNDFSKQYPAICIAIKKLKIY